MDLSMGPAKLPAERAVADRVLHAAEASDLVAGKPIRTQLADLLADPSGVPEVEPEAIPYLLGQLEQLKAALWARLSSAHQNRQPEDRLLTAKQAAPLLGTTEDWLRRRANKLPFTVTLSPGQVRYSSQGIQQFIATRRGR